MAADRREFRLPLGALALVLLPLIVIHFAGVVIGLYGYPLGPLGAAAVADGHAEAAGRLKMLATWLLLTAGCVGGLAYFFWTLRSLARLAAAILAGAYLLLAGLGVGMVAGGYVEGAQRYLDERVICDALRMVEPPAERAAAPDRRSATAAEEAAAPPAPAPAPAGLQLRPGAGPEWRGRSEACPRSRHYRLLLRFNEIQKYLLALLIPGLVLGTISCLALPKPPTAAACRMQVGRLNVYLYLTAALLVMGLLFLSAMLHWPGYALAGDAARSYKNHVDAYILYWGVAYSIFIASYYVPVAALLTAACEGVPGESKPAGGGARAPKAVPAASPRLEMLALLKTLAALFAPAIAGLLGGVIKI